MKIGIVAPSPVPYGFGGAERAWQGLADALNASADRDAELVTLPSPERDLVELLDSYRRFAELDVSRFDLVISSKYPAWMIDHPNHVVYLFHRLRGLYDTYRGSHTHRHRAPAIQRIDALLADLSTHPLDILDAADAAVGELGADHAAFTFPGPLTRAIVHGLDDRALHPNRVRRHVALSDTVRRRAGYFPPQVPVDIAYLPPTAIDVEPTQRSGIFTASRLDGPKRIDLLIEAMRHVDVDVPVRIAGTGPADDHLRSLAAADPRIEFMGHLSDEELWQEYRRAEMVTFFPVDEDYGLITVEAQHAATPVITCFDSGGPTELIRDGRTGRIVRPDAREVGAAIVELLDEPARARELGDAGHEAAAELSWDRVIATLLATDELDLPPSDRPKIVIASSFVCNPPIGGGQLRCHHLYRGLAETHDVHFLSLGMYGDRARTTLIEPGVVEEVVPRSWPHTTADANFTTEAGIPVHDITTLLATEHLDPYLERLRDLASTTAAVVLAHPYLYNAVRAAVPDVPLIYDAHNVETSMKAVLLPESSIRDELLRTVAAAEVGALADSTLTVSVSASDEAELRDLDGDAHLVLIENGADVAGTRFVTGDQRRENSTLLRARLGHDVDCDHVAVFVASWHPPNNDAAAFLVELADALPRVLFVLAGGHTNSIRGPVPPNVLRLGIVSDLTKVGLLQAADVALNPMASGGGSNLKLIEYLASGTPVVTTELGARGFDLDHGVHLTVAPRADFAAAVAGVLADTEHAADMATAGRRAAEQHYDWGALSTTFARAIADSLTA